MKPMRIPFFTFLQAVGIYALITLPALIAPIMYALSLFYVFVYGWFAWALFTGVYLLARRIRNHEPRMAILMASVVPSVAFAFHMLGHFNPDLDAWNSGGFLVFPACGCLAGWISVHLQSKVILRDGRYRTETDSPFTQQP